MKPSFVARGVSIEEDVDGWTLGLADDFHSPGSYLIIQRSRFFDDRDRALGLDNVYYEFDDQLKSFYGGLNRIQLSRSVLRLWIDEKLAQSRGIASEVGIELAITGAEWKELRSGLRTITESYVQLDELSIGGK